MGEMTEALPTQLTTGHCYQESLQFVQFRENVLSYAFHKTWAAGSFQEENVIVGPGCVPSCL